LAKFLLQYTRLTLFKTQVHPGELLNIDIKEIPGRLLQSAVNISTSRITAFLELILKPISTDFCKSAQTIFVKTAVNTLKTCSVGKTA